MNSRDGRDERIALTAKEVSKMLGIPVYTVYEMGKDGRLPAVKIGKHHVRFNRKRIEEMFS